MRKSLVVAVLAASTLLLASCAMPADQPGFNADDAAFGVDASAAAQVATDATSSTDAALAAPTSIGVDAPLSAAPAAGALIVSLSDGSDQDTLLNTSMAEAAKVIGWDFKEIAGADSVDTAPAAFDEALALKPAGIRISGGYVDVLADGLAKAEAAGIPVVCTGCSGEPAGAITDTSIDGDSQNTEWGNLLSSYVYANQAEGEVAGVEMFSLPVPALATFNTAFTTNLGVLCRECSTTEEPFDPTLGSDIPTFVADTMTTSLGRWALLDSGTMSAGVADSLLTAPVLEPIVLIGRGASAADIATLRATPAAGGSAPASSPAASPAASGDAGAVAASGTPEAAAALQAWTALPVPVMGWRIVDQFARIIGGDALADGPLPSQLLTSANAQDAVLDADGNYIGVADYQDQFKALWGVK
ncbi:MAG: hypothetical protein NTX29_14015 [Actinobacteria bacterium]|nr:hypothetical protein [Actinomycetota bacterium]